MIAAAAPLVDLVYPPRCPACESTTETPGFCGACRTAIQGSRRERCHGCGSTLPASGGPCVVCGRESFAFSSVAAIGRYEGELRRLVLRAKRPSESALHAALAELLADEVLAHSQERYDCVVPAPLHWRRRWLRGGDQASLLAERVASRLGTPFLPAIRRKKPTRSLADLAGAEARRQEIRGAFEAAYGVSIAGMKVLLVDDVMTTGATCHAAADVLLASGAARVHVAVAARAEWGR